MDRDPQQLLLEHPELGRWALIYFLGFIAIACVGWNRIYQRSREGTLRIFEPKPFPIPFHWGLSFFLILIAVLFAIRGAAALIAVFIGYFFFLHQFNIGWKSILGLDRFSFIKIACASLGLIAISMAPTYFLAWFNSLICLIFKLEVAPQPLIEHFLKMNDLKGQLYFIFLAVVAAPVMEEILFRGLLYPLLRNMMGIMPAVLISGFLFGIAHLHYPMVLPLTFLGVLFALTYEYTGSLLLTILMHAVFNLFTVLNLLLLRPYLM